MAGFVSAIPQTFNVHGRLLSANRTPLEGTYFINFSIYNVYSGGSSLWNDNLSIGTDTEGIYNVILKDIDLDFSEQYYLGIGVEGDAEMIPRMNLTSSPYVFRANVSDYLVSTSNYEMANLTLSQKITFAFGEIIDNIVDGWIRVTGGLDVTGDFKVNGTDFYVNSTSGYVGIGTDNPDMKLKVIGDVNVTGILYADTISGEAGLNVNNSDYLDGYDSTFFMPLNTSVSGDFDFNGGWTNGGFSISGGDIYAQTGWFYNISSLEVNHLNINGSLFPDLDDAFDIGNASLRWRNLSLSGDVTANNFLGNLSWDYLNNYPSACPAGSALTQLGDTVICTDSWVNIGGDTMTGNLIVNANFTVDNDFFVDSNSGNVGIGTSSPSQKLHVEGNLNVTGNTTIGGGSTFLDIYYDSAVVFNLSDDMVITGGNVGIGISSPISGFKLDVQGGDFRVGDDATAGFEAGYSEGGGVVFVQGYNRNNSTFVDFLLNNVVTITSTGNVGIGTSIPTTKLELRVNESRTHDTLGNNGLTITNDYPNVASQITFRAANGGGSIGTSNAKIGAVVDGVDGDYDADLVFSTREGALLNERVRISSSGNVGIGTSSPSQKLHVEGNLNVTGIIIGGTPRQNIFRVTTGSYSIATTAWTDMSTANGTAIINGPFCYALQSDGIWVDTANHKVYLRLALTPVGGGTTLYLPNSIGHMQYYYVDFSRLDSWTNNYCASGINTDTYNVVLQWSASTTDPTKWSSVYGHLNLAMW